jgi:hypothetical protein
MLGERVMYSGGLDVGGNNRDKLTLFPSSTTPILFSMDIRMERYFCKCPTEVDGVELR